MILFNTTFCIDEPLENNFIDFLKKIYIPAAYSCGMYKALLSKIRAPRGENGLNGRVTVNYALQLRVASDEICCKFTNEVMPILFDSMDKPLLQALNIYCTELDVVYDPDKDGE